MRLEAIHLAEDHENCCPTCGGGVRRRTYGEMHAGSFILDRERVEIRRGPQDGFADPIVLDALTQYFDGGLYRLWPGEAYYTRGGKKLHRHVWEDAFGPIPRGCHIHHRDGDPGNNALSNLECMDGREHLSHTWHATKDKRPSGFSDAARNAAAEWHRSEAGRLWHKRHAKRSKSWTKWKREPRDCRHCGKTFDCLIRANGHQQKYCSTNCKVAAYRERGKQNEWAAAYRARKATERDG